MKKSIALTSVACIAFASLAIAGVHERYGSPEARKNTVTIESQPEKVSLPDPAAGAEEVYYAPHKALSVSLDVPFELAPTQDEFGYFTLLNPEEGNTSKWRYQTSGMTSPCSSKWDMNAWAITPAINFTNAENNYELSFTMQSNMQGDKYVASVEFYIGTAATVEAMTTKIGEVLNFYSPVRDQAVPQSIKFALPGEAGKYYIGFRCITPKDHDDVSAWPATFKKIAVKEIESAASAPGNAVDATVTAGENGALTATAAFKMPTLAMNSKPLAEDKELTAVITSPVETKTVKGLPGSEQSVEIATNQGDNKVTIRVNGDLEGEALEFDVYTGVVLPMRVHDLKADVTPDNLSMTLSWTRPTEGKNGGYVDFDLVEYDIYICDTRTLEYSFLETVGKELTYTYTLEEGASLRTVQLRVLPRNAAGTSDDTINWVWEDAIYVAEVLGTPYALPVVEDFANCEAKYTPVRRETPDDYVGKWMLTDPVEILADDNQAALVGYTGISEGSTVGRVAFPKTSTKGIHNAKFEMKYLRYSSNASKMVVYVRSYDKELTLLGEVDCSSTTDWQNISYPLPMEFQDQEWVEMVVDAYYDEPSYMYAIDTYSIVSGAESDLAIVDLKSESAFTAGDEATIVATILNAGFNAMTPKVRFEAVVDGTVVAQQVVEDDDALESNATAELTWNFPPTVDMTGKEVLFKAVLLTEGDMLASNNNKEYTMTVRRSVAPVVTDLAAEAVEEGVQLTWSEPDLTKLVTESFESAEAFSYDEELCGFSNIDCDGYTVYKFSNNSMPNEQLAKAFMVVDYTRLYNSSGLEAYTGNKYLMATCPEYQESLGGVPGPADDWLITPLLGNDSHLSFYIDIINYEYPETIRLMVSTTGNDVNDFTELSKMTKSTEGWEKVEVTLPEGAKYFAINYVSKDQFGILVDDIEFRSNAETYNVEKYNIYRDGELVASTETPSYLDSEVQGETSYRYHVTVVSENEGIASNIAEVTTLSVGSVATSAMRVSAAKGTLIIDGFAGQNVVVSDAAGRVIFNGVADSNHMTLAVSQGVYIVKGAEMTQKAIVR